MAKRGLFLTFEGGEGSGKSTQIGRLMAWLETLGIPAIATREPGGTELGSALREIVLNWRKTGLASRAELLLYEADRAQHVESKIRPALATGQVVVSDRYADSAMVYQGICRGLGEKQVGALNAFATGGLRPDRVFLLDLPETEGLARARSRGGAPDRLEGEALAFHKKVRAGFRKLARREPSRFQVVDARRTPDVIEKEIRAAVEKLLKRRELWKG